MADKLTREQAAIIGAYTKILCGPFSDLHKKVEDLLGRPVMTHELGGEEIWKQIRAAVADEFIAICVDDR